MQRLADAVRKEPTPEGAITLDLVLAVVANFAAGRIDVWEVRRRCTGHDRYVAARLLSPSHPLFRPFMAMLDELIATEPGDPLGLLYDTKHGVFTESDIRQAGGHTFKAADGRVGIRWPAATPSRKGPLAIFRRDPRED